MTPRAEKANHHDDSDGVPVLVTAGGNRLEVRSFGGDIDGCRVTIELLDLAEDRWTLRVERGTRALMATVVGVQRAADLAGDTARSLARLVETIGVTEAEIAALGDTLREASEDG